MSTNLGSSGFQLLASRDSENLRGVRGWLLFFVIVQSLDILVLIGRIPSTLQSISAESLAFGEAIQFYRPVVVLDALALAGFLSAGCVGLLLIHRRASRTPLFYRVVLGAGAAYGLYSAIAASTLYPRIVAMARDSGVNTVALAIEQADLTWAGLRTAAVAVIWLAYWIFSERVAQTFPETSSDVAT